MSTTDELLEEMLEDVEEYATPVTDDDLQFWIDEHLRVISIPKNGVVAGVEGDKNVNKIKFGMNRYYHGFDMSTFSGRILYSNAKGNKNYYNITDMQTSGNTITFSWLVDADAVQYMGKTAFVIYLFKAKGSELRQKFYSTLATLKVLEGMEVDSAVPIEKQTDIIERMKEEISAYAEEVKKSLPADYTAMTEQVNSLKEDLTKIEDAKVDKPSTADDGKIPRAKEGEVEWVEVGQPTDEQTSEAVTKWLDKHPEATTTVQNGAIEEQKININFLPYIKNNYVTPEMFGANENVEDNSESFIKCIDYAIKNGLSIYIPCKKYKFSNNIILKNIRGGINIVGECSTNSQKSSLFEYMGDDCLFKIDGCSKICIKNIAIKSVKGKAILLTGERSFNCTFENVYIVSCKYGIYIDSTTGYTYFTNVNVNVTDETERSLYISTIENENIRANYIYFNRCSFDSLNSTVDKTLVELSSCYYIFFNQCDFANADIGIVLSTVCSHLNVSSCCFYNLNTGVLYDGKTTVYNKFDLFSCNIFKCKSAMKSYSDNALSFVSVNGCSFECDDALIDGNFYNVNFGNNAIGKKPAGTDLRNKIVWKDGLVITSVYTSLSEHESKVVSINNKRNLFITGYKAISTKPSEFSVSNVIANDDIVNVTVTNLTNKSNGCYIILL